MHLRSLRLVRSFIPIKGGAVRKRALKMLRAALRPAIEIKERKDGISLEGEFLSTEIEALDKVTLEVSRWARSSRPSR